MSADIINQLQPLQEESGKSLSPVITAYLQNTAQPRALVDTIMIANGKWVVKPRAGASSLLKPQNRQSIRKVKTLSAGYEHIIKQLNTALLGGESYPVLTAVLGTAAGFASAGAGLLFTIATTALSLGNTVQRVLARTGDEIWHVEEIGKVGNKAMYISSYFIVDPYRNQAPNKGWLIHEEREEVQLS
jgi:hypothetical protein